MAQLVQALRYKAKGAGSIPDGVTDIILPALLWPSGRHNLQQKRVPGIFPGE